MKKFALIVAGGSGSRMGNELPKQFLEIKGRPILMHTIEVFYRFDKDIVLIVVLPENQKNTWKKLCETNNFDINHKVIGGGETRFHSVKNGLGTIVHSGIVFIHDGVRPLVSQKTIEQCFYGAVDHGNAIPVVAATESLRMSDGNKNIAVDRSKYFQVQTPQTFNVKLIKEAYEQEYSDLFTDDASVLEKAGQRIFLAEGNFENIKITRPMDLKIAEALMK